MEPRNNSRNYKVPIFLARLPGKIISLHGRDNITEFVLHDLASKLCFNLAKATYLVDNPDFDHLKGVAGYIHSQAFEHGDTIWENPDTFSRHMEKAPFNKSVRAISKQSPKRGCLQAEEIVESVAKELDMDNPKFFCWNMKHNNHGLLVYEHMNGHSNWDDEDLLNGLHLLSLCPVF